MDSTAGINVQNCSGVEYRAKIDFVLLVVEIR